MPGVPDAMAVRGEWISLLLVTVALWLAIRPLSRLLALPQSELGDLFWNGGLAFVVVGRVAYVAIESREALTDPLVLVRIQGGIEPLAGLLAAGAMLVWRTRRDTASRHIWLAAFAGGLVITTATYDLACVARDACYGTTAPSPLGFAMSGLSDARLATPLIEAALLLLAAGALLSSVLPVWRSLVGLAGIAALVRVALTPLSVLGTDAVGFETVAFAVVGAGALMLALRGAFAVPAPAASVTAVDDV